MATPTSLPAAFVSGAVLTAAQQNDLRGAFRILQVVSTAKTDTFTSSSTTFTDITGLSVSITPSDANNKILVFMSVDGCSDVGVAAANLRLMRDSTAIAIGDAAGSRDQVTVNFVQDFAGSMATRSMVFLDSPATTSATTYKVQGRITAAGTFFINRSDDDANAGTLPRGISTITVFEVSA
jgi:hypothetical protein